MKKSISCKLVLIILSIFSFIYLQNQAYADSDVKIGSIYKVTQKEMHGFWNGDKSFSAKFGSKFKVVKYNPRDNMYGVRFTDLEDTNKYNKTNNYVEYYIQYYVNGDTLTNDWCQFANGFYLSGLTLPIKYRFKIGNTPDVINYNVNVNGVLGYTFSTTDNLKITPVIFVGITPIITANNKTTIDNSNDLDQSVGISEGFGLSILINDFQIGLIGGWDHKIGEVVNTWPYQNHFWISIGIGLKFLDF